MIKIKSKKIMVLVCFIILLVLSSTSFGYTVILREPDGCHDTGPHYECTTWDGRTYTSEKDESSSLLMIVCSLTGGDYYMYCGYEERKDCPYVSGTITYKRGKKSPFWCDCDNTERPRCSDYLDLDRHKDRCLGIGGTWIFPVPAPLPGSNAPTPCCGDTPETWRSEEHACFQGHYYSSEDADHYEEGCTEGFGFSWLPGEGPDSYLNACCGNDGVNDIGAVEYSDDKRYACIKKDDGTFEWTPASGDSFSIHSP